MALRSIGSRHEVPVWADNQIEPWWPQQDPAALQEYLPILLRAVLTKVAALAEVPLFVAAADDPTGPRDTRHPALRRMRSPQPADGPLDGVSLLWSAYAQVELRGSAHALRDADDSYWLTATPLHALRSRERMIAGWRGDQPRGPVYNVDEVLHLRVPNALRPYGHGLNVIQTMARQLETYLFGQEAERRVAQRGGVPSTVWVSERPVTPQTLARMEQELSDNYGGYANRGKQLILSQLKPVRVGQNAQEGEASETLRNMIMFICGCVGVPAALCFPNLAQHADLATLQHAFYVDQVDNTLRLYLSQWTQHLRLRGELRDSEALYGNIEAVLRRILPLDKRSITAQRMLTTGATPNEIRTEIWGLAPSRAPGMDTPLMQGNLIPMGSAPATTVSPTPPMPPAPRALPDPAIGGVLQQIDRALRNLRRRDAARDLTSRLRADLLAPTIGRVTAALSALQSRIVARLNELPADQAIDEQTASDLLPNDERETWWTARRADIVALVQRGYGLGEDKLQAVNRTERGACGASRSQEQTQIQSECGASRSQGQSQGIRELDEDSAAPYAERIGTQIRNVPDSIRNELERLIAGLLADDQTSVGDLRQALDRWFDDALIDRARADRIAQTEIGMALMAGQDAAYKAAGVEQKEWLPGPDSAAWERRHDLLGGNVIPIDAAWSTPLGNLARHPMDADLPAEDVVYCQCDLLPVVK